MSDACPGDGWDHDHEEDICLVCDLRAEVEKERARADGLNKSVLKWMADFFNADKAWAEERKAHDKMCPDAKRAEQMTALARECIAVLQIKFDASKEEPREHFDRYLREKAAALARAREAGVLTTD